MQKFFQNIQKEIGKLHTEVNEKIKHSESLRELEKILEQNRELFPSAAGSARAEDRFEAEKKKFDEKIAKGRFAYLVKRQDFYD